MRHGQHVTEVEIRGDAAMTWRQLFARRPKWWVALVVRLRAMMEPDAESASDDAHHVRSSAERARFWEEFRAGQREADLRIVEERKALAPS
jgi:hypothetical protein